MNELKLKLSKDELKVFASAITWTLWTPFDYSNPPSFTMKQRERLQAIFDLICQELHLPHTEWNATLTSDSLTIHGRTIADGNGEVRDLILCLAACYAEIGHSPTELAVVTGVPALVYSTLLTWTRSILDPDDG